MCAPARLTFIPDVVEEHYDELQFLWSQRRRALRSPAYTSRELGMLEERIEARAQGMQVIGERILDFVAPGLAGDDELPAFAAAFALLRLGTPEAAQRVADAFAVARGPKLAGLRDALASNVVPSLHQGLGALFLGSPSSLGACAGEVLAFQGSTGLETRLIERLVTSEEPAARAGGWRLAAYVGAALPPHVLESAYRDDDPTARGAALEAAAWTGSPTFAPLCRALAASPAPEVIGTLATFAALASPEEYQLVGAVAANPAAGPDRFRVIGSFGHPYFVEQLVREMEHPDAATAAAAGLAFTKMTGREVQSDRRARVPLDDAPPADAFEAEFQDEVFLPDPDLARRHWQELAPALARAPRICRGLDLSQALTGEQFALLDMESRWEYCLRARLFGGWPGSPLDLERFPQRF